MIIEKPQRQQPLMPYHQALLSMAAQRLSSLTSLCADVGVADAGSGAGAGAGCHHQN